MTVYRNVNEALPDLAGWIMLSGNDVRSRAGDTKERTMVQVTLTHPRERAILIPERKASLAAQIAETMWVLSGRDDIEWLKNYLPRAGDFSDDGKTWRAAYGPRLRAWKTDDEWIPTVDQLANVVDLLKNDPTTRQAVMTIWDPVLDWTESKDIPCNNWLHFLQRNGRLDLHVAIRSNDLIWGWSGINQFEWSTLLEIVAGMTGFAVGSLTFSISSLHIYERHWERAKQIDETRSRNRKYNDSAWFEWSAVSQHSADPVVSLDSLIANWFTVEEIIRTKDWQGAADAIRDFPEPMLRSWLYILGYYWHENEDFLSPEGVDGTTLAEAARWAPARKPPQAPTHTEVWQSLKDASVNDFAQYVTNLHNEKHAAYGDSWKRRGEQIGIMANIARKVDRLGVSGAGDTATDTAVDLLVYLAKYEVWLNEQVGSLNAGCSDGPDHANEVIKAQHYEPPDCGLAELEERLAAQFTSLEQTFSLGSSASAYDRREVLGDMIPAAFQLAYHYWLRDQERQTERDGALNQPTDYVNDRVTQGLWGPESRNLRLDRPEFSPHWGIGEERQ